MLVAEPKFRSSRDVGGPNTTDGTVFRVGTTPTSWTAVKAAAKVSIIYHLDGNSLVADEVVIGD